jgi:SH3 domain-containing protein
MGELKLKPQTNVLALKIARAGQGEADGPVEAKSGGHRPGANGHRPGATEAGLPLTPQRLELVKEYARQALRHAHAPSASQIAQRFAPRAETAVAPNPAQPAPAAPTGAPFTMLASGIRRLTVVLVIAALLPNLTLAAFWLRLVEPPWSRPVTVPAGESPVAQPELALPVLSAPLTLDVAAGQDVLLPIALDGTDHVPAGSVIVIKGLPPGSTLSNGRAGGETDWTVRPDEIGDLHLVPAAGIGEAELTVQLVAPNNAILADAATRLNIIGGSTALVVDAATEPTDEVASIAPVAAITDEPTALPETVPLPTRRPAPGAQSVAGNWVRPSAYVNLRDGPAATARVVSIVAKGTKLRVVARKRGWVQVADPATSQSGWIYSGHTETVP